jgi:DHA2 family multidrug resistance protein-like MFS transporter
MLPEHRSARTGQFDWISSLLSMAAIVPLIYGIKECAVLLGAVFAVRQHRAHDTVLDATLFAHRRH